jgi:hypothetical protein
VRVLWVATKPPVPTVDGGCVVARRTLEALADAGVTGTVVAPAATAGTTRLAGWRVFHVPAATRLQQLAHARRGLVVARHVQPAVRRLVATLLEQERFDVVHAEQVFALPQCAAAAARGVPVVLRVQNVEHEVLAARADGRLGRRLLAPQVRRLRAFEEDATSAVAATTALTARDAGRLGPHVVTIPAPFPAELPAGPPLDGAPALVVFGSAGWFPNRRSADWLVRVAWPAIRSKMPGARLHVVGLPAPATDGATAHPAPADSAAAFPTGAILLVASRVETGVRMKILEAWARGIPVVATPEAATGLGGHAVIVADDAASFADAVARLHRDGALAHRLTKRGREVLRREHDPAAVARQLARLYDSVIARPTADPPPPAVATR